MMNALHKNRPSRAPAAPPGLVQSRISFGNQLEAARNEWFILGTEQTVFAQSAIYSIASPARKQGARGIKDLKQVDLEDAPQPRITAPTSGTIVALDPDIPPNRQRVSFSAEGQNLKWLMDGKEFAHGAQAEWLPWPGRHVVQITDARGATLDEVRLEVRGAGVKLAAQGFKKAAASTASK
jgi:penicillin-binding protein 1C